jgi:hypothetical protein
VKNLVIIGSAFVIGAGVRRKNSNIQELY